MTRTSQVRPPRGSYTVDATGALAAISRSASRRICSGTAPIVTDAAIVILLRCNKDRPIAKRVGQIVLHREYQVAAGQAGGETLREGVQLTDLFFPAAKGARLVLEPRREIAGDQRDQEEKNQIDDVLRIANP